MMRNLSKTFLKSPIVAGINYILSPVIWGGTIGGIFTVADTPASRQMLINYVDKNYNIDNSVHNAWQAILKAKGYPQKTRNVAISNGSECGTDQTLSDLLTMHHESKGWFVDVLGALLGVFSLNPNHIVLSVLPGKSRYHYDFVVRPMTKLNENKELYNGRIVYKKKILWAIPAQTTLLSGSNYQPEGVLPIDKYSGGKYAFPKKTLPDFIGNHISVTDFSFIPTPSAIDYKKGNQSLTEADYQKSFSPNEDLSNTPFTNFVAERISGNHAHISFSDRNGQFIINQLSGGNQDEKISTTDLCGSRTQIGGENVICETDSFNTVSASSIYWYIAGDGNNIAHIVGDPTMASVQVAPNDKNSKGLITLIAQLADNGSYNKLSKQIWIGKPDFILKEFKNYYDIGKGMQLEFTVSEDTQGISKVDWVDDYKHNSYLQIFPGWYKYTWVHPTVSNNDWAYWGSVFVYNKCGKTGGEYRFSKGVYMEGDTSVYSIAALGNNNYLVLENSGKPTPTTTLRSLNSFGKTEGGTYQIELYNAMGNRVLSIKGSQFSISSLPVGSYYAKIIKDGKIVHAQTLIKN